MASVLPQIFVRYTITLELYDAMYDPDIINLVQVTTEIDGVEVVGEGKIVRGREAREDTSCVYRRHTSC
jgi:hypothetical protein